MPWCPKCKLEFKDDFSECPDCHIPLVDELTDTVTVPEILFVTEDEVQRFVSFLKYSNFEKVSYEFNSDKNLYELVVEEKRVKEAFKLYHEFIIAEKETREESESTEDDTHEETTSSTIYVKSSDRYSDFSSTGIMLLIMGLIGVIYVILNIVGVIHFINNPVQYVLNTLIFIGLIWYGFYSLKSAKHIKGEISQEEENEKQLTEWLNDNITSQWLDEHTNHTLTEEANIINQMEEIKKLCSEQFPNLPENMIESLIDDFFLGIE